MGERGGNLGLFKNHLRDFPQKKAEIYQKMSVFFNKTPEIFSRLSEKLG
jgi:hypothetical protein